MLCIFKMGNTIQTIFEKTLLQWFWFYEKKKIILKTSGIDCLIKESAALISMSIYKSLLC